MTEIQKAKGGMIVDLVEKLRNAMEAQEEVIEELEKELEHKRMNSWDRKRKRDLISHHNGKRAGLNQALEIVQLELLLIRKKVGCAREGLREEMRERARKNLKT